MALFGLLVAGENKLKALRALALLEPEPSTPVFALRSRLAHARQQGSEDLPLLEEAHLLLSAGGNDGLFWSVALVPAIARTWSPAQPVALDHRL
jgi:hypothetical protein